MSHARLHGYDLTQTLVFLAVWRENVRERLEDSQDTGAGRWPPSDASRRRVTVLEVSNLLNMPYETTRRHVNRLIDRKLVVRDADGVYIPLVVLARPEMIEAVTENYDSLGRLMDTAGAQGLADRRLFSA